MQPSQDRFPIFEANQVLTSGHLNDVRAYLHEQERLTRAQLVGVGIVCGLDIQLGSGGKSIHLSKGCGVTSQGYLIVQAEDVELVACRANYTVPPEFEAVPPALDTAALFVDPDTKKQYPLWELLAAGEANAAALDSPAGFLDDKAVLLLIELNQQALRNCSLNGCDDKGSEVTVSFKPLLMRRGDVDKLIAASRGLAAGMTASDLAAALLAQLNLPDLRLPRFNVPNTGPVSANEIYLAFLNVFRPGTLAQQTAAALSAAWQAFKPLLEKAYPADPFAGFSGLFGFLDLSPATAAQVRFLQYYHDLFDDLLRAYDEFRWQAAELACACCPPEGLFPRHLALGLLHPETAAQPGIYRQGFLQSPAVGACAEGAANALQLFARLVEMALRFTDTPALPKADDSAKLDPQIRITPSKLGDAPLAAKAIPYYYRQDGSPALYTLWSREQTRRQRPQHNLSYNADQYTPAAPPFVSNPLAYDLEPYNFLRIEGHLGKDYQAALSTLLSLRNQYRLPVDIVALRSGAYDDSQAVDLAKESARFQDLEAVYADLSQELLTTLTEGVRDLYDTAITDSPLPGGTPQHPLLKAHAPNYRYPAASVGAWYEKYLTVLQAKQYIDVDQNQITDISILYLYCILFAGTSAGNTPELPNGFYPHAVSIYYLGKLAEILPPGLDALAYKDFENKYQDLLSLVRYFRSGQLGKVPADLKSFIPQEELIDQFNEVLFSCKLDPIKAIHDEYVRRVGELKKQQFLSNFLQRHPGIQHKAGAPLGGTFILVYHQNPSLQPILSNPVGISAANAANLAASLSNTAVANAASSATAAPSAASSVAVASALSNTAAISNTSKTVAATPGPAGASITAAASMAAPLPVIDLNVARTTSSAAASAASPASAATSSTSATALSQAIGRIQNNQNLLANQDINLVIGSLLGQVPSIVIPPLPPIIFKDPAVAVIADAVNTLADGAVIADFYLPYPVSSNSPGVQFVLPKHPPAFTVAVGCANSDGATATLSVKGGVPPYEVKIDDQDYQALADSVRLGIGSHTLLVRDAESTESAARTVKVLDPVVFGEAQYNCSEDGKTYTATFSISGGLPPYTANGKTLDGSSYTTDPVPSGTKGTLQVLDSRQCAATIDLFWNCCTLPCFGVAMRRGYRFWLPDFDPNNAFQFFKINRFAFSFELEPGAYEMDPSGSLVVDLSADILDMLQKTLAKDLNANFAGIINQWLTQINKLIANKTGSADWLILSYEPGQPGGLGTLWIERFQCLKFSLQTNATYTRRELSETLNLVYTTDDCTVQITRQTPLSPANVKIPAFGGLIMDKCNRQNPVEDICPDKLSLVVAIIQKLDGQVAVLSANPTGDTIPTAYLWEVQDGNPPMSNEQTAKFSFTTANPPSKLVRLTAFTGNGCFVTTTDTIALAPPTSPPIIPTPSITPAASVIATPTHIVGKPG